MRDSPLVLYVSWGKGLTDISSFEREKREMASRARQKKEKPRGNGACRGNKQ